MVGRCDGAGARWRAGGDAGVLRAAEAARADRAARRGAVQLAAAAARHRLHRRSRTAAELVGVVVATATAAAAAAGEHDIVPRSEIQRQRAAVFVVVVRVVDRCAPQHFVVV